MHRVLCLICLLAFSASIVGCGGDSVNDASSAPSPETAKAAAAKMPPPPDMNKKK